MPTSRHIPEANPELPPRRAIASIKVGKRYRRDFGDIAEFARRIASVGFLQPVVITPGGQLIDGLLRLEALKKLGHTHVPVHVVDIDAIVYGELAANVDRKNFTPSELVAITEAVEKRERELARQRMTLGKLSTGSEPGKARDKIDKIAKPHGMSGRTLEKARAVVQAAKTEPEKYNKFVADMDRTGRVNGPYRRLKNAQQAEQLRAAPPPLPGRGPYYGSIIDNPWAYEPDDEDAPYRGVLPYPTMSIEQICSLDMCGVLMELGRDARERRVELGAHAIDRSDDYGSNAGGDQRVLDGSCPELSFKKRRTSLFMGRFQCWPVPLYATIKQPDFAQISNPTLAFGSPGSMSSLFITQKITRPAVTMQAENKTSR